MRQLTGQDAAFLYMESQGAHLHVCGLSFYDPSTAPAGKVSHKDILAHIESRLDTSPVYRQKLLSVPFNLDFPYWVNDENFNLEFHIRHIALPAPRDWRQLCILVARIHSRPLDMTRPPWEMHVIEGLDNIDWLPEGSYAILAKHHHAAIDGATGVEITAGMHDTEPDAEQAMANPVVERATPPSTIELFARAVVNNVTAPFQLMKVLGVNVPGIASRLLQPDSKPKTPKQKVPRTRFNRPVTPQRVFEGQIFSFDSLRAIKNSVKKATINDVVLAICSGALRQYLQHKEELPAEPLVAMAPINTRRKGEQSETGNTISAMFVDLHTDEADPLIRLRAIRKSTGQSKEIGSAVSARQMTDINKHIPASTLALAGRLATGLGLGHRLGRLCNCVITNVPGPQVPLYMNGATLTQVMAQAPVVDGMGLIIVAFSYNGSLTISFTACRESMPDPELFSLCLRQSFEDLQAAVDGQLIPRKKMIGVTKVSY